jgi:hypothetical protein
VPSRDGGKVCTSFCTTECSEGWECTLIQFPGADPTFLCIQPNLNLCRPCTQDAHCQSGPLASPNDRCVRVGDIDGSFCGIGCVEARDCPDGYACRDVEALSDGATVKQCVPEDEDAECGCSGRAIEEGAYTACNDGTCVGTRVCGVDGLSACSAAEWSAEVCDGRDNDCNGTTDDGYTDTNSDGEADCIDDDIDGDGVPNDDDNCRFDYNPDQSDLDQDLIGDACDDDIDGDGVLNEGDNCPLVSNAAQIDTDGDGTGDACDTEAPLPPVLEGTTPASPAPDLAPVVFGKTEVRAVVTLYADALCAGEPLASIAADGDGAFSVATPVFANATTEIHGTATDGAGNVSPCTEIPLLYQHDDLAPMAPVLVNSNLLSPTRTVLTPTLVGMSDATDAGLIVRIYASNDCSGIVAATATPLDGGFNALVTVLANSSTPFTAVAVDPAGNVSACSNILFYEHDTVAPPAPVFAGTNPLSPSNASTTPDVFGYTELNATVRIYTQANCGGNAVATTTALTGEFSAQVQASANATTTWYATATDPAGNVSPCSTGISYTHNTQVPDAPVITGSTPTSPSRTSTTPVLTGTSNAGANATVSVFAQPECGGATVATIVTSGAFNTNVTVPANSTTIFTARVRDAAGNVSACSAPFAYTHDDTEPSAPVLEGTTPVSPSATILSPNVFGSAEAGVSVAIFRTANCAGAAAATVSADAAGDFAVDVLVPANAATTLTARATDAAGNVSACSAAIVYVHDANPPARPVLTGTNPVSPSNTITQPEVIGTTEGLATLAIFANGTCAGQPVASGSADANGNFAIPAEAATNATTTFTARATDAAGNASACSLSITYTHDNLAPATPTITASNPTSPSSTSVTPILSGTTDANTTVALYATANCSGTPIATATSSGTGFQVTGQLQPNTTRIFRVRATDAAGNVSGCSAGFAYTHDNTAPATPTLTGTTPASPSNATTSPFVDGSAEAGATIRVYTNATCTGTPTATLSDNPGTFAVGVSVTANSTTTFHATATDAAGNTSGCSSGVTYTHDNRAPTAPVLGAFTPASPSRVSTSPSLAGTTEAGTTVRIFASANCSGAAVATLTNAGASFSSNLSVSANSTTTFTATATDAAGNTSACSNAAVYVHDNTAPAVPVITGSTPTSPSNSSTTPTLAGTAEDGTTVRIYTNATCTSAVNATGSAPGGAFAIAVTATANGTRTFYATATDAAGNESACSNGFAYAHDNQKPAAPSFTGTSPTSPSRTSTTPTLLGTTETGAVVRIFAGSACGGTALATVNAAGTNFSAVVTVTANSTATFTATATDAAGNVSDCATAITYRHDNQAPAAPNLTSTTPTSPSNNNLNPVINGTAEAGSTVRMYTNSSCNDPMVGTATTADATTGTFGIAAAVSANSSTTFYARATDAAGNVSPCSNGITYVHNNIGSSIPIITGSTPPSPSNSSTTPIINGTADNGSTVRLFTTSNCTGTQAGSAAVSNGTFAIQVTVGANTTTTFYANAIDAATNVSGCSSGFTYVHDNVKPATPTITGSDPASPSRSSSPTIQGTSDANVTIRLYTNNTCTTAIGSATSATAGGTFGVGISVGANSTTTVYATATDAAGNLSGCSSPFTYVADNNPPPAPLWSGATPASPSNATLTPTINGGAENGTTVRVFASSNCSGTAVATLGPLSGTAFSFQPTVTANSTTTWTATATDAAGNVSACSATFAWTHDNTGPAAPVLTGSNPTSPSSNQTAPNILGTTAEAGVTIQLFKNANCSGTAAHTLTNATASFSIATTVTANSSTSFTARAVDPAGNTSGCSNVFIYTHDNVAPGTPVITSSTPTTPSRTSTTPTLNGTAEAGATVNIYTGANCLTLVHTGTAAAGNTFAIAATATANATTTFFARAVDAAGNQSACSAGFAYTHDTVAPTRPTLTGTNPNSPSSISTSPTVQGTTSEASVTVRIYTTANCTGSVASQSTIASTSFGIATTVTANATTPLSAQAVDAAGNVSACSDSISYTHDNLAPTTPVITATNPVSPSNTSTSPQVSGTTGEANITVRLFTNSSCTGSPIATGTATASGATGVFTIAASATANATTTFYAQARDAAGNNSGCSAGFAYVHDNTAPPAPVLTAFTPASPSTTNSNTSVQGTEGDATARVLLYPGTSCGGTAFNPLGTVATNNSFSITFSATSLGCTPVSARAIDPAGNQSTCSNSLTFAHYGCAQCPCSSTDWIRQFGSAALDWATSSAVDSSGNVFVAGYTAGALSGQTHAGSNDAFVAKYNASGVLQWLRQFGTTASDVANAVRVDSSGNVYVAGQTQGDINGAGAIPQDCPATNCGDVWIAKYNISGTRQWITRNASGRMESTTEIEWDSNGSRIVMLASSSSTGGGGISPQVLAVNATTGAFTQIWAYIDDNQNKNPGGLAVDGSGNIYVHGRSQWALPNPLSTTGTGGNGGLYIYKVSSAGTLAWLQHWGSDAHDIAYDIVVDASGNVFAAGFLQGVPLGTGAIGGPYRGANGTDWGGWGDAAVARFNSSGAQQWARIFGTPLDDLLATIHLYDGKIFVSGQTRGNAEAGTNTSKYGLVDFFVATLNLDGSLPSSFVRQFGTSGNDSVGRGILTGGGLWYLPGSSDVDWTGLSRDACTYAGGGDARLSRFCAQPPPAQ